MRSAQLGKLGKHDRVYTKVAFREGIVFKGKLKSVKRC